MSTDISSVNNARQPAITPPAAREATAAAPDLQSSSAEAKAALKAEAQMHTQAEQQNLERALEDLNNQMKQNGRNLNFKMDETLNRPIVTVVNSQTGEVVRQIPNEVVVRVAHHLDNLKGMLLNEKS
jgi:flagellar protein FlaG